MDIFDNLLVKFIDAIPSGITIIVIIAFTWTVKFVLNKRLSGVPGSQFRLQVITLLLTFVSLLLIILSLPISESTIGQLLSLIGILLSAAIALSATTFVGNIMAGMMLRIVKNFRSGDFVRVGDHFGRVSERGLFHIEIQTEDRDLTTLPNLYLVTNPVKVIRSSGTLVTADVSLGYDIPHMKIEKALIKAATEVSLEDPFVHIISLGDFSVTYRISGLLTEVKSLLSTRSQLKKEMLVQLHKANIEIVSPTFMNQRVFNTEKTFRPNPASYSKSHDDDDKDLPEVMVFDKADAAESIERIQERQVEVHKKLETYKKLLTEETDETKKEKIQVKIDILEKQMKDMSDYIEKRKEEKS